VVVVVVHEQAEAMRMKEQYQREWKELRFTVRDVHFMSRSPSGPFEQRKSVPLLG
jgi:hypothetical protein